MGNILMLKYVAEKLGAHVTVDIVSLKDRFDPDAYDIAFFGGGQDYEQTIVSEDLPDKKKTSNASFMTMAWSLLSVVAFSF